MLNEKTKPIALAFVKLKNKLSKSCSMSRFFINSLIRFKQYTIVKSRAERVNIVVFSLQ